MENFIVFITLFTIIWLLGVPVTYYLMNKNDRHWGVAFLWPLYIAMLGA